MVEKGKKQAERREIGERKRQLRCLRYNHNADDWKFEVKKRLIQGYGCSSSPTEDAGNMRAEPAAASIRSLSRQQDRQERAGGEAGHRE